MTRDDDTTIICNAIGEVEKAVRDGFDALLERMPPSCPEPPASHDTWTVGGLPGTFTSAQADAIAKQEVERRKQWDEHYEHVDRVTQALTKALDGWYRYACDVAMTTRIDSGNADYVQAAQADCAVITELRKLVTP